MRIFITGGTGFVGSHILRELSARGHELSALVRTQKRLEPIDEYVSRRVYGDLDDKRVLEEGMAGVDAVVHAAGLISPIGRGDFRRVNVRGTLSVLRAATRTAGALERFVYLSSIAACGPSAPGVPLVENDAAHPVSAYGRSKLEAEREVMSFRDRFATTIVRPPVVYGPGDTWTLPLFKMVAGGTVWSVNDPATRVSLIHVSDLAAGVADALEKPNGANETFYLSGDAQPEIRELVSAIEDAVSRRARIKRVPRLLANLAAAGGEGVARLRGKPSIVTRDRLRELLAPGWLCSADKAKERLGWQPKIDFRAGIRDATLWYQDQGWLSGL